MGRRALKNKAVESQLKVRDANRKGEKYGSVWLCVSECVCGEQRLSRTVCEKNTGTRDEPGRENSGE